MVALGGVVGTLIFKGGDSAFFFFFQRALVSAATFTSPRAAAITDDLTANLVVLTG